ncbi:MAG: glycosyltransferase family 4 protein [Candidatus Omnitrophota bacterium]
MKRLAVIPSDPLEAYKVKGIASRLENYYNPGKFFDEVYLLSPLEKGVRDEFGMRVIHTKDRELQKRIRDLNIDVIRAYGGNWPCDMACGYKVKGIPVVVSVHDKRPQWLHASIKKADIVFCVSEEVKGLVLGKFDKSGRAWVLPNRVDLNVMRPFQEKEIMDLYAKYPFKYRILHVGRKSREKNLDTVIRALKILGERYCLLAVGDGKSEEYIKLSEEQGVSERCFFLRTLANEELARYYSWADCLCNPSRSEAMSSALVEAMACGTVVVTSVPASGGVGMEHMKDGLVLEDYENPESVAEMVEKACGDSGLRTMLIGNARESARRFEKGRVDELEISYYEKILEMKNGGEFKNGRYGFWNIFRK